jgi:hypothetical protein
MRWGRHYLWEEVRPLATGLVLRPPGDRMHGPSASVYRRTVLLLQASPPSTTCSSLTATAAEPLRVRLSRDPCTSRTVRRSRNCFLRFPRVLRPLSPGKSRAGSAGSRCGPWQTPTRRCVRAVG